MIEDPCTFYPVEPLTLFLEHSETIEFRLLRDAMFVRFLSGILGGLISFEFIVSVI